MDTNKLEELGMLGYTINYSLRGLYYPKLTLHYFIITKVSTLYLF